jgi:hypothetical protein
LKPEKFSIRFIKHEENPSVRMLEKILMTSAAIIFMASPLQAQDRNPCIGYEDRAKEVQAGEFKQGQCYLKIGEATVVTYPDLPISGGDLGSTVLIIRNHFFKSDCKQVMDPYKEAPLAEKGDKFFQICYGDRPVYIMGPIDNPSKKSNTTYIFDKTRK